MKGALIKEVSSRENPQSGLQTSYPKFEVQGRRRTLEADEEVSTFTKDVFEVVRVLQVSLCGTMIQFEVVDRGPTAYTYGSVSTISEGGRKRVFEVVDARTHGLLHTVALNAYQMGPGAFRDVMWGALCHLKKIPKRVLDWMPELKGLLPRRK